MTFTIKLSVFSEHALTPCGHPGCEEKDAQVVTATLINDTDGTIAREELLSLCLEHRDDLERRTLAMEYS